MGLVPPCPTRRDDLLVRWGGEPRCQEVGVCWRSAVQVRRDVAINQFGEVIRIYRILRILTERKEARRRGKYAEIEPAHYTDADYARIDEIYASEGPRGAEPRYWEDVTVGDALPPMVKGPLTVTEIIAFHAGGYGFVPYGLHASRVATGTGSASPPSTSRTIRNLGRGPTAALGLGVGQGHRESHGL